MKMPNKVFGHLCGARPMLVWLLVLAAWLTFATPAHAAGPTCTVNAGGGATYTTIQ